MTFSTLSRRLLVCGLVLAAVPVFAQAPSRVRVRGTVEKLEGAILTVKSDAAGVQTVYLAENTAVSALEKPCNRTGIPGWQAGVARRIPVHHGAGPLKVSLQFGPHQIMAQLQRWEHEFNQK